jgi:hypothetical protein
MEGFMTFPHWIIVVVAFSGGDPLNSKLFGPIESEAACKEKLAELVEAVHASDLDLWAECREVKLLPRKAKPKPQGLDGKPLNLKPERNS